MGSAGSRTPNGGNREEKAGGLRRVLEGEADGRRSRPEAARGRRARNGGENAKSGVNEKLYRRIRQGPGKMETARKRQNGGGKQAHRTIRVGAARKRSNPIGVEEDYGRVLRRQQDL